MKSLLLSPILLLTVLFTSQGFSAQLEDVFPLGCMMNNLVLPYDVPTAHYDVSRFQKENPFWNRVGNNGLYLMSYENGKFKVQYGRELKPNPMGVPDFRNIEIQAGNGIEVSIDDLASGKVLKFNSKESPHSTLVCQKVPKLKEIISRKVEDANDNKLPNATKTTAEDINLFCIFGRLYQNGYFQ